MKRRSVYNMKNYYPAYLDLTRKPCLVIGGGNVASRKINSLIKANANITVISPGGASELEELVRQQLISWEERVYQKGDIKGFFLIIIATSNNELNLEIYKEVDHLTQLVNIVDSPDLCTFIVPSIFRRGFLQVAISTHGASPGFSKKIRTDLEKMYGEEYTDYTTFLAEMREWIFKQDIEEKIRRHYFNYLLEDKWLDNVTKNGIENAVLDFQKIFKKEINHIE